MNKLWLFKAYKSEAHYKEDNPYHTQIFYDHDLLKRFSAYHSLSGKRDYPEYVSTYDTFEIDALEPIRFAEWILEAGFSSICTSEGYRWSHARIGSDAVSSEQLYQLFLKENNELEEDN